jgi:hypothetical protein
MAGEKRNEESEKKREWNDGDATLHSMSAPRILPQLGNITRRFNHPLFHRGKCPGK